MPPGVYHHVRDEVHRNLQTLFKQVSTPTEAAAKADYGDVDVLVCEELVSGEGPTLEQLETLLGAIAHKHDKGSEQIHFALPWPEDLKHEPLATDHDLSPPPSQTTLSPDHSPPSQPRFLQLDLHVCPSLDVYAWQLFRYAHGDFWTIVGSVVRHSGLSFRNSGLYIRIADVEKGNKKLALVQLTQDPGEVLKFLFNDGAAERFWKNDAFASVEEMCDFIRSECTFYRPLREKEAIEEIDEDAEKPVQRKHRSKLVKRRSFRCWLEEYVPKHSPEDREQDFKGLYASLKREEVADMVIDRFDVRKEYEANQKVGLREMGVDRLWAEIRSIIPLPSEKNLEESQKPGLQVSFVLRTLRRKVSKDGVGLKDEQLIEVERAYREGRFEEVKLLAQEHWKEVAEKRMAENEEKSRIHYRTKMERIERERREAEANAKQNAGDETAEVEGVVE